MSRTDHPRKPGSHSALTRMDRRFGDRCEDYATWQQLYNGNSKPVILPPATVVTPEEPLAEWERVLLDLDLDDEADEDEGEHYSSWMPLVTIEEARDIFCGGDFIIDHTNVQRRRKSRWDL